MYSIQFNPPPLSAIIYYLLLPFIYLISILPFRILYLVSDALYLVLYYLVGYRKKVVATNLKNAFPGKSEAEIRSLQEKVFRFFCDLSLETFKTLTISRHQMLKHCSIDPEATLLFDKMARENKNIITVPRAA